MRDNTDIFLKMQELTPSNSGIDMHMHTMWTDGKDTLIDMVEHSVRNGLRAIAITDHIRETSDYYSKYLEEIENIRRRFDIKIYSGFESKIKNLDGEIDLPVDAAKQADIVIASVHRLPYGNSYRLPKELPYKELAKLEKNLALSAIRTDNSLNVLGHCGGMSISAYGAFPEEFFEEVIRSCSEVGVAFEYNYKYHAKYENVLKKLLIKYNPFVSIGSDAHEAAKIANRSFCDEKNEYLDYGNRISHWSGCH